MYYYLFTTNTLSPTLSLKSPENFRKFTDREVPVFATFVKSLSEVAASKLSLLKPMPAAKSTQNCQFWPKYVNLEFDLM